MTLKFICDPCFQRMGPMEEKSLGGILGLVQHCDLCDRAVTRVKGHFVTENTLVNAPCEKLKANIADAVDVEK